MLGLICDPVAGLVEVPCVKRNALGASQAIVSADMALTGVESVIPTDEVIQPCTALVSGCLWHLKKRQKVV